MRKIQKVTVMGVLYESKTAACRAHNVDRNRVNVVMKSLDLGVESSISFVLKQKKAMVALREARNSSVYKPKLTGIDAFIYRPPTFKNILTTWGL